MPSKLSDFIDNLSGTNNNKKKNANHTWKEIVQSECVLIRFRNNRLNYKCKECGKNLLS